MKEYKRLLDALEYWAEVKHVCVDENGVELSWRDNRSKGTWKELWEIKTFYTYDCVVGPLIDEEIGIYNFDADDYRNIGRLISEEWFGKAERLGFRRDNKTALKLCNILTGEVVYMGWYDGKLSVSKREPYKFSCCHVHEIK